jgi:hypothetical protein
MYLINGTLVNALPFRLHLPDGRTRTSLHELDDAQLAELGIYPCDEIKPPLEWTQHHGTPVIEVADGRATATYPVLDYSPDEVAGILDAARERKRSEIAAARFEAETAGIDVNGFTVRTDRESQALITGAALQAIVDYDYECRWKTSEGFVHLSAEQIKYIAQLVRSHVQSCFDREAELCGLIDKAETPDELGGIAWGI